MPNSYEIEFSLMRSSVRRRVLAILVNNGPLYISEIARLCKNITGNVIYYYKWGRNKISIKTLSRCVRSR
jgi:hypothetical protein